MATIVEHDLETGKKQVRELTEAELAELEAQQVVAAEHTTVRQAAQAKRAAALEAAREADAGNDLTVLGVPTDTAPDLETLLTALICKVQRLEAEILELRGLDT